MRGDDGPGLCGRGVVQAGTQSGALSGTVRPGPGTTGPEVRVDTEAPSWHGSDGRRSVRFGGDG